MDITYEDQGEDVEADEVSLIPQCSETFLK